MLVQSLLYVAFSSLLQSVVADPPSIDPFYQPPTGFETSQPGTILRSRQLSGTDASVTIEAAFQILYRTIDSSQNAAAAVTTVLIPPSANFSQLLSYQAWYDSPVVNCAPSHSLQPGANDTTSLDELNGALPTFLNRGIVVSIPDYEGEAAAFTAGPQAGYATLDAIRAVLASSSITGVQSSASTIMYGYSGGSIATEYAAELQPTYAPTLSVNIIGAAAGGLPINLTSSMLANVGGSNGGLAFSNVQGLANGYPDFASCLEQDLIPATATQFHNVHYDCNYGSDYAYQNVFNYLNDGAQFVYGSCWNNVVNEAGIMGTHGVPTIPMYVYKGTSDEIVPTIEMTDTLISHYCTMGAKIEYVRYVGGNHAGTNSGGFGGATDFIFGLFGGGSPPTTCTTTNLNA